MKRRTKDGAVQPFLEVEPGARGQQIRDLLRERMKGSTWKLIAALFDEEVEELCGPRHTREHPDGYRRGGSDGHGLIHLGGQRVQVTRPRVRRGGCEQSPSRCSRSSECHWRRIGTDRRTVDRAR